MSHNFNNVPELELVPVEKIPNDEKLLELYKKIQFLKEELKPAQEINNLLGHLNGRLQK